MFNILIIRNSDRVTVAPEWCINLITNQMKGADFKPGDFEENKITYIQV